MYTSFLVLNSYDLDPRSSLLGEFREGRQEGSVGVGIFTLHDCTQENVFTSMEAHHPDIIQSYSTYWNKMLFNNLLYILFVVLFTLYYPIKEYTCMLLRSGTEIK